MRRMDRRRISGRVTDESYDAWKEFARLYGVTFGAIIEALGERLGAIVAGGPLTRPGREIVTRAREIDQAHRSRRDES